MGLSGDWTGVCVGGALRPLVVYIEFTDSPRHSTQLQQRRQDAEVSVPLAVPVVLSLHPLGGRQDERM